MGYAYPKKICERLLAQIYAKGKVSVKSVSDDCIARGIKLSCAEGEYEEPEMIRLALEEIINCYLSNHKPSPREKATPVIEVVEPLAPKQLEIYNQWIENENDDWDTEEYEVFDSIEWKFAAGWRKRYPNIPLIEYLVS